MKNTLPLILCFLFTQFLHGQPLENKEALINRLYREIAVAPDVQSKYIGCYGNQSTLYKKADSLRHIAGMETFAHYFEDHIPNLQYYSFIEILGADLDLALAKIKQVCGSNDTILFDFAGQNRGQVKLTELLIGEYLLFIKRKYYYGGIGVYLDRRYEFGKKSKRTWKRKTAEAYVLVSTCGLSRKFIEGFVH